MELAKKVLSELRAQKIHLKLNEEDNIEIVSYDKSLSSEMINKIKSHKQALVDYLKMHNIESVKIPVLEIAERYPLSVIFSAT
jgi:hypothetical protein